MCFFNAKKSDSMVSVTLSEVGFIIESFEQGYYALFTCRLYHWDSDSLTHRSFMSFTRILCKEKQKNKTIFK